MYLQLAIMYENMDVYMSKNTKQKKERSYEKMKDSLISWSIYIDEMK